MTINVNAVKSIIKILYFSNPVVLINGKGWGNKLRRGAYSFCLQKEEGKLIRVGDLIEKLR